MSGILYIISAPSGSGKTTLVNELRQYVPSLEFSISFTTRPPRGSEQDGREYHFISREEFEAMIGRDGFLEYALVLATLTARPNLFCSKPKSRVMTCCSISTCRASDRSSRRCRMR